jgi:hypothetical protein
VCHDKAAAGLDVQAGHCAIPHLTVVLPGFVDRGVGESLTATAGNAGSKWPTSSIFERPSVAELMQAMVEVAAIRTPGSAGITMPTRPTGRR